MKGLGRRVLKALATILGVGTLTMLLLEVVLRLVPSLIPADTLRIFNADLRSHIAARRGMLSRLEIEPVTRDDGGPPHRLWRFRGSATIDHNAMDAMGFCNVPADAYARDTTIPVITVGDSFTYCWFVTADSAWPALLGTRLGTPAYSLGLPDMGLHEEVQLLTRFGVAKHPRVVALVFYEGNDLSDAVKVQAYRSAVRAERGDAAGAPDAVRASLPRRIFYTLMESPPARRSYAFNLGVASAGLLAQRVTEKQAVSEVNFRYHLTLDGQSIAMNPRNTNSDDLATARSLAAGRIGVDVFSDALREFLRLAVSDGFTPVIVYMPSAHNVYRANVAFDDSAAAPPLDAMREALLGYWHRMADSLRFRLVDLTPVLRRAAAKQAQGSLLYKPNDLHLSTIGHRVVADSLGAEVRHLLWPSRAVRR